ncbi:alpha/beta fold hydrolase [Paraburkholderia sediminicola]|uniref:hypothetical protein n=1 Tax=Paraburkholderia sediminicola TaxID=458836 RepID=UPI0038BCAF87
MAFVFFHGIEQQDKKADELRMLWIDSIRVGLDRAGSKNPLPLQEWVVMPYYGDLLARLTPAVSQQIDNVGNARDATARIEGDEPSRQHVPSATMQQLLGEIRSANGDSRAPQVDVGEQTHRGFKNNVLGALSNVVPIAAQNQIVSRVLRQVAAYLDDVSLKRAILEIASSAIREGANASEAGNEPLIVVAHSLGSVIALEALADFRGKRVDLLMTIGSPLYRDCGIQDEPKRTQVAGNGEKVGEHSRPQRCSRAPSLNRSAQLPEELSGSRPGCCLEHH